MTLRPLPRLTSLDLVQFLVPSGAHNNHVESVPQQQQQIYTQQTPSHSNYPIDEGYYDYYEEQAARRQANHTVTVTDEYNQLTFQSTGDTVRISFGMNELVVPKKLWRTLEASRHSQLSRAETKFCQSRANPLTHVSKLEQIRELHGFHPVFDAQGEPLPYSENPYDIWWTRDVFDCPKEEDNFSDLVTIVDETSPQVTYQPMSNVNVQQQQPSAMLQDITYSVLDNGQLYFNEPTLPRRRAPPPPTEGVENVEPAGLAVIMEDVEPDFDLEDFLA